MDNPLDTAGDVVKDAGEYGSGFLFSIARYLEQLTGDATSAAIFAGFLLFTLGLLKVGVTSKHSELYAKGLLGVGAVGIVGVILGTIITAYNLATKSSIVSTVEERIQYKVITNRNWGDLYSDELFAAIFPSFGQYKWYLFVFVVLMTVGFILNFVIRKSQKRLNVEPS